MDNYPSGNDVITSYAFVISFYHHIKSTNHISLFPSGFPVMKDRRFVFSTHFYVYKSFYFVCYIKYHLLIVQINIECWFFLFILYCIYIKWNIHGKMLYFLCFLHILYQQMKYRELHFFTWITSGVVLSLKGHDIMYIFLQFTELT